MIAPEMRSRRTGCTWNWNRGGGTSSNVVEPTRLAPKQVQATHSYGAQKVIPARPRPYRVSEKKADGTSCFGLVGHSANITVSLPYGVGNFSGKVVGTQQSMVH